MSEEVLGQNSNIVPVTENSSALEAPSEKMLRQSEVNDLVGSVKAEAAAKAVENYKRSQQETAQPQANYNSSNLSEDRIRELASQEAQHLRDKWVSDAQSKAEQDAAQRIVKNFHDKMSAGKDKYEDFDKATSDIELHRFPNTVHMLAEQVDNAADVLYELSKNRSKMAQLEISAREFPQEALYDLKRLSESIKNNESVSGRKSPNAPLNQQRPTNIGTDAGGVLSLRDLKAKYRG